MGNGASGLTTSAAAVALTRLDYLMLGAGARIDRFVLEFFLRRRTLSVPDDGGALRARLERAREFYSNPAFMAEPDAFYAPPAPLEPELLRRRLLPAGEVVDLSFASEFEPVFPEARAGTTRPLGLARWWKHHRPGHPAVVCVHGYGGGQLWLESLAFDARRFYRAGVDVILYVLPFHGGRALPGTRSGEPFFDMDLVRTNEAFAQAIYELRALVRYLAQAGPSAVGAFGMSLGGYTTALLASVEPQLAFAVPMIPLAALADMMWTQGENDPRMASAIEHGWSRAALEDFFRVHAPLARPPLVPRERRLLIAALGDHICPPAHADALWRHWDRPRMHWYPGGHLAQFRRGVALREVRTLLRDVGLLPRRPA
jgi:pimeloyl-ACP methyl ester carboxylesterase